MTLVSNARHPAKTTSPATTIAMILMALRIESPRGNVTGGLVFRTCAGRAIRVRPKEYYIAVANSACAIMLRTIPAQPAGYTGRSHAAYRRRPCGHRTRDLRRNGRRARSAQHRLQRAGTLVRRCGQRVSEGD